MILGLGNDIIEIERIAGTIERQGKRFLEKVFTSKERAYCLKHEQSERQFAGRFAAKEAVLKAFGTGLQGVHWLDIEILNDELGKPYVVLLSEELQQRYKGLKIHLSISHCKAFATAVAILTS